jgi:MoaA/NifB/PqqE/SkfB family radical SAM enzyme
MVAVPGFSDRIVEMRRRLPSDVYLWLNAQQPRRRPYSDDEIARFSEIDPMFRKTFQREPSRDRSCRAGETSFTVDGNGDMRRCHFVDEVIGNVFASDWRSALEQRKCPRQFCNCFLGKAQLLAADLTSYFGDQLLERIVTTLPKDQSEY